MTDLKDLQKALDKLKKWFQHYSYKLDVIPNQNLTEQFNKIIELFSAVKVDYEKVNRDLNFYREANIVLERDFVVVRRKQLEDRMKEADKLKSPIGCFANSYSGEYQLLKELLEASGKEISK
jgi:hypothetical protein